MDYYKGPLDSLVSYEPPIEINQDNDIGQMGGYNRGIANMESRPSIEDILNAILPPREWDDSGKHYIQFVSHNKASRDDVSNLQKKLD
jgi:dynein light intermediate chain